MSATTVTVELPDELLGWVREIGYPDPEDGPNPDDAAAVRCALMTLRALTTPWPAGTAGEFARRRAEDDAAWDEVGNRLARMEQRAQEHDERLDRLERWRAGTIRRALDGGDPLRRAGEA